MGKGDKKSRKGKIIMGTYGVSRPRKRKQSYKFVPRTKNETGASSSGNEKKEKEVSTLAGTVKPKKKAPAKKAAKKTGE